MQEGLAETSEQQPFEHHGAVVFYPPPLVWHPEAPFALGVNDAQDAGFIAALRPT